MMISSSPYQFIYTISPWLQLEFWCDTSALSSAADQDLSSQAIIQPNKKCEMHAEKLSIQAAPMVGFDAMTRANSTLEDFVRILLFETRLHSFFTGHKSILGSTGDHHSLKLIFLVEKTVQVVFHVSWFGC
jgi:hypothetical protein